MVPAFLGKPKPPLPVSGSQASNATWRWNWCSFLNCVRRRMATFFFCAAFGVFFLPSLSMQPFYYTVLLSGLSIFFHQRIGIYDDFCINQQCLDCRGTGAPEVSSGFSVIFWGQFMSCHFMFIEPNFLAEQSFL